jgi:hypothetical protein
LPSWRIAAFGPPSFSRQDRALRRRAGVAPQLGRPDHLPLRVERHEAMLLARNADAPHAGAIDLRRDLEDHGVERGRPLLRMLFQVADRQAGNQPMRGARLRDDLAGVEVEHDRLDALGSGIDAEVE